MKRLDADLHQHPTTPTGGVLLGALAAGFALGAAPAAAVDAAPPPATAASAPTELPAVRASASSIAPDDTTYRAVQSRIGKGVQALRDIPQSVTVVTEKLMDDKAQDTVKSALHGVAGITFEAGEGGGIGDLVRLRGFAARGDMLMDGLRDIAQYNRDNFNLDRLEVLRGAASMLFGRGSTGGVINQSSKLPTQSDKREVSLTVGEWGYGRLVSDLDLQTGETAGVRLVAMATEAKGARNGPRSQRLGVAPSIRWGIDTPDEFTVSLFHLQYDDVPDYGFRWYNNRPVDAAAQRWYGRSSDYQRDSADVATFTHTHRFGNGNGELRTTLREGRYNRDLQATTAGFAKLNSWADLADSTAIARGNQSRGANDVHRFVTSDYSVEAQTGSFKHQIIAGVEWATEATDVFGYVARTGTSLTPVATTWGQSGGTQGDADNRVRTPQTRFTARTLGAYVQDTLSLSNTWKLVLGLRHDGFEAQYHSLNFTPVVNWSRRDSLLSPRGGVLWQPSSTSSYYVSYGSGFATTGDLYQFGVSGATDADRQASAQRSANTAPEGSRNLELGAKWDLMDRKLSLRTAVFSTTKTNERNTDVDTANNAFLLNARRHTDGVEFEANGRVGREVEVFASLAVMKGRIDSAAPSVRGTAQDPTGLEPGLTPRYTGSLWGTWKPSSTWRLGAGLEGRSSTKPALAELGSNVAPGYGVANMLIEYAIKPTVIRLNLNNVAGKVYADGIYRGFTTPGAPRTALLTVSTQF